MPDARILKRRETKQNTKYMIKHRIILLGIACLLGIAAGYSQSMAVQGKVIDSSTQESLIGVSVQVKGTAQGTITDVDGGFSITVPAHSVLVFSYLGYRTYEQEAREAMHVRLQPESQDLEELVVIGYGAVKKKDLTGAVSSVNAEELRTGTSTTIAESLQGRVPGLQVKTSGEPGQTAKIYLRGISSMFSDTDPLYVIDGLPTKETRDFNPDDIESIQVLKDASAAAIYGSRAANGVIIITTKKGKKGEATINASAKYGIQNATKRYDLMNGAEWLAFTKQKYDNAGLAYPDIVQAYVDRMNGVTNSNPAIAALNPDVDTDWQDQIYQTGQVQEYNLSASGGNDVATYMVSGNHFRNTGIIIGPKFDRTTVRVNGTLTKGRLRIEESLLAATSNSIDLPSNYFNSVIRMVPLIPLYDENGDYALGGSNGAPTNAENPLAHNALEEKGNKSYRLQGAINAELEIFKFLRYKLNLGYEMNTNIYSDKIKYGRWIPNGQSESQYYEDRNINTAYVVENTLTYDQTFNGHHVNAMVGYTEQKASSSYVQNRARNLEPDNRGNYYWTLQNGTTFDAPVQVLSSNALRSILGRVTYSYNDTYYLTASIRRDGSSRFRKENRWGNFPSVAASWRISNERFMEDVAFVNDLKIRASYGLLGQEAIPNNLTDVYNNNYFPYIFGTDGSQITWGSSPTSIVNTNLYWEEKESTNVGLDMTVLNNSLTLNADYYINKSKGLLAQVPIGYWTGSQSNTVWQNAGSVQNSGFEFSVTYRNYNHPFKFDIMANVTTIKNKILALGNDEPIYGTHSKSEIGRSLGELFLVRTDGIYQESDFDAEGNALDGITEVWGKKPRPGDVKYVDCNGLDENGNLTGKPDGIISIDDRQYVGSPWPKAELSLSFNASWKNFDLSVYLFSSLGRKVYNNAKWQLYNVGDNGNYGRMMLNAWSETNPTNEIWKPYADETLPGDTDWFVESGDFLRLKTLQLGYNMPKKWMDAIGLGSIRIYLSAENLFTITKYTGLDPDFKGTDVFSLGNDPASYPNVRTFSGGIQLSF